jgi:hypothetical protein
VTRALALLLLSSLAAAQPSPSPLPDLSAERERKLREDDPPPPPPPPPSPSPAPVVVVAAPSGWARFLQLVQPDVAAIVDITGGYYSEIGRMRKSLDDPGDTGFKVQQLELAFQANVDRWFRADVFVTFPNLDSVVVDEAYASTTRLPGNLQVKAGIFRAQFGRQNTQHLHQQDFTRRPGVNTTFLGAGGLRAPGVELNFLVPKIPFQLLLGAAAFSVEAVPDNQPVAGFGGGARYDFTYMGYVRAAFQRGAVVVHPGVSFAYGNTSQGQSRPFQPGDDQCFSRVNIMTSTRTACDNFYNMLWGFDLYLQYKRSTGVLQSLTWQTEYFLRHIPELKVSGLVKPQAEGGFYTQLVAQLGQRWFLGLRGEMLGAPAGALIRPEYAAALAVTCQFSEFARLRLHGEVRIPERNDNNLRSYAVNGAVFLQLEAAIGSHGARH